MSGVETTLQRQLGVKPQVSMDENTIWFRWDKPQPLDPARVFRAVTDGGMGLNEFRLLGYAEASEGNLSVGGLTLDYEGAPFEPGMRDVEIIGYETPGARYKAIAVNPFVQPKVFNPKAE